MDQRDRAFYWQFISLNLQHGSQRREVATARDFLTGNFASPALRDSAIARQLYQIWQAEPNPLQPTAAELCLRCYISNHIEQACWQLVNRFGTAHGFGIRDLLPLVLTDVSLKTSLRPVVEAEPSSGDYVPCAAEILKTYRPERGSLGAWVNRLVSQQRELADCLRDYGVYLITDWALLNDTKPHRLSQMLSLSAGEVARYRALLNSYHAVYRRDRLATGATGRCLPPDASQRQRMVQYLAQHTQLDLSASQVFSQLRDLAGQLRVYRLQQRNGAPLTESLDDLQLHGAAIPDTESDTDRLQREFLRRYHDLFRECLVQACERALWERLERRPERAAQLLEALYRFHACGETMTEIAACIGLKAQFQVSRLLQLKQLRAKTSQYALEMLSERMVTLAQAYRDPDCLHDLYAAIQLALSEELAEVASEAAREAEVKQRQQPPRSLFARSLCECLVRLQAERRNRR